jgi:hypothetical protein
LINSISGSLIIDSFVIGDFLIVDSRGDSDPDQQSINNQQSPIHNESKIRDHKSKIRYRYRPGFFRATVVASTKSIASYASAGTMLPRYA